MSPPDCFLAIDLGAGSGRAILGRFDGPGPMIEELRRFHYAPVHRDGHLRWDARFLLEEVEASLRDARRVSEQRGESLVSVGVDAWGVDYGLLDADGLLLEDPICYRDHRTDGMIEAVTAVVSRDEIFARTGIQFLPFNTLYQLHAHQKAGLPGRAACLLLIPDVVHSSLCGRMSGELTNASTTQMLSLESGDWDMELLRGLGLPIELLPRLVPPGTDLGPLRPALAEALSLPGVRVVAPATHDTASAVVGTPLRPGWAYVSSGTWSLVGVERARPLTGPGAARANFTNEGGAYGTVRFLKNVMGLWILESCRREWAQQGRDVPYADLLARVASLDVPRVCIDPDDPRFLAPRSMLTELRGSLANSGHAVADDPVALAKVVLDSLALRYAQVIRTIEGLTGDAVAGVHLVGGGSLNDYLNQATADASGLPVVAGPVEATAIGNLVVQAITRGRFQTLAAARGYVAGHVEFRTFRPSTR